MSRVAACARDLQRAREILAESGGAGARVAARIAKYHRFARNGLSLSAALGLEPGLGELQWYEELTVSRPSVAAEAKRAAVLRELSEFYDGKWSTKAKAIAKDAQRYEANA